MAMIELLAKIEFFKTEISKRKSPIMSGYRPIISFDNNKVNFSCKLDLLDRDGLEPGSTTTVKLTFIRSVDRDKYFTVGQKFSFSEGLGTMGVGEFIEIIKL
jgi:translation elongation factor EF-Tu-like GTPase